MAPSSGDAASARQIPADALLRASLVKVVLMSRYGLDQDSRKPVAVKGIARAEASRLSCRTQGIQSHCTALRQIVSSRMFRCFAQDHEELAGLWAGTTGTNEVWTLGAPIGTGESGSFHITSAAGRRGACKPAFGSDTTARAAHEKIAADLAHALKLSVPACCLWTDPASGKQYSISMWAFSQAETWGQVFPSLSRTYLSNAAASFGAARVFHTWIGDHDHAGHGGNVVVDLTSTEDKPGVAFIDHAFSMSRLPGFDSHPVVPLACHYVTPDLENRAAIQQMCQYINELEDTMIEEMVRRVPAEFLPLDKANVIITGLLRRRQELPRVFGVGI